MTIVSYANRSAPHPWRPDMTFGLQALYDPSDLSSMSQSVLGGVPVTGPGQPVGRILDKSKPLGLDFANPLPNAGIQESGDRTGATWNAATKTMFLTDVGTLTGYPRFEFKYPTMVIGRTYQIDGRLSGDFGNITQIRLNTIGADNVINLDPVTGIMSGVAIAGAATIQFSFNGRVGATSVVIETLSIREVPGNHASQATVAARPILQRMPKTGRRNLLTETDDLTKPIWTGVSVTKTQTRIVADTQNTQHRFDRTMSVMAGDIWQAEVKAAGYRYAVMRFDSAATVFDLETGTVLSAGNTNADAGIVPLANGRFIIWIKAGANASIIRLNTSSTAGANPFVGDNVSGLDVFWQQLERGARTAYQKVTNTYDVTEAGVPDLWSLLKVLNESLNVTLAAGTYTRININGDKVVSFDDGVAIAAPENILRQNTTAGAAYVNRTLSNSEKAAFTAWGASR